MGPDDPGGGPPVEGVEGLRWWFEDVPEGPAMPDLSWSSLLSQWDAIETDFQHFHGIDFGDGILHHRSWRWFRIRVIRLLAEETQLARVLKMPHTQPKQPATKQ